MVPPSPNSVRGMSRYTGTGGPSSASSVNRRRVLASSMGRHHNLGQTARSLNLSPITGMNQSPTHSNPAVTVPAIESVHTSTPTASNGNDLTRTPMGHKKPEDLSYFEKNVGSIQIC